MVAKEEIVYEHFSIFPIFLKLFVKIELNYAFTINLFTRLQLETVWKSVLSYKTAFLPCW